MFGVINGVDTGALAGTIEAIRADAGLGAFNFRISNEWISGGLNRSTVRDFGGARQEMTHVTPFVISNDEPAVLLSGDQGPNPVENLLHALAGCLTTTIVYHAAARGIRIDAMRTRFDGDIDLRGLLGISTEVRNGYRGINVSFEIEGDLTEDQKRELIAMGPRYSPVFDVVSNGTPITCRLAGDAPAAVPGAAGSRAGAA
jgi:uncharacterized OsmC-like protein